MPRHLNLEKLREHASTNHQLAFTELNDLKEPLIQQIDIDFSDESLTGGQFEEVEQLVELFFSDEISLEDCLEGLSAYLAFFEKGLVEHQESDDYLPDGDSPDALISRFLEEGFLGWVEGLTLLIDALQQDNDDDVEPALMTLLDGNRSVVKLNLLLHAQGAFSDKTQH